MKWLATAVTLDCMPKQCPVIITAGEKTQEQMAFAVGLREISIV